MLLDAITTAVRLLREGLAPVAGAAWRMQACTVPSSPGDVTSSCEFIKVQWSIAIQGGYALIQALYMSTIYRHPLYKM